MQKIRKLIDFSQTLKTQFCGHLGPLLLPKISEQGFSQKIIKLILSLYATVTSCKTSEKFHAITFYNTSNTSFWAHFGSILAETPQNNRAPRKVV